MNLDELQSIQSKERQTDSLQPLRASFYEEVGEYVQELRAERERVAAEEGFDAPEFRRLSDEIDAAEDTVESLYERRVGKVVKAASFAAAGMPAEDEGLTAEEQDLFDTLVADIEQNRARVLDVLSGEGDDSQSDAGAAPDRATEQPDPDARPTPPTDTDPSPDDGVDAADLMGADESEPLDPTPDGPADETPADDPEPTPGADRSAPPVPDAEEVGDDGSEDAPADPPERSADGGATAATIERTTVRITRDVGEILGVDERAYDLGEDDVVTLPSANADPLVERDAAERLE